MTNIPLGPENASDLFEQIVGSNALKIQTRLITLKSNFTLFHRNYEELNNFISSTAKGEHLTTLWNMSEDRGIYEMLEELVRLFHNYLASAKTLVDHTRVLINDSYKGSAFMNEYSYKVHTTFVEQPMPGFIEGLRNYALHYQMPAATANVQASRENLEEGFTVTQRFILKKETFLKWSSWPPKAKIYMDTLPDEIDIKQLAADYYQSVLAFHSWMLQRLSEIHQSDLAWL